MIRHQLSKNRIDWIIQGEFYLRALIGVFSLLFGVVNLNSCSTGDELSFPYDLDMPSDEFILPPILNEVSGLTWASDGFILANQDEDGVAFSLDAATGELVKQDTFWKPGDYEGIEIVGETVWVAKSKGNLYAFSLSDNEENIGDTSKAYPTKVYKTALKKADNIETLAYDESNNCLWLVGKGSCYPNQGTIEGYKAWTFNLISQTLSPNPVRILFDPEKDKGANRGFEGKEEEKAKQLKKTSCPSGLAIHPFTKEWYLLSSEQGSITVWDSLGVFVQRELFNKSLLPKAEGICFSPNGTLYIASEASRKSSAKVVKYKYHPEQGIH